MGLSPQEVAAFVEASCRRQGVPVKVTDAAVVGRVSALLRGGPPGSGRSPERTDRPRSESPDGIDPGRVESSGSGGAGSDHDVVEDRFDDGGLAGEVELGP